MRTILIFDGVFRAGVPHTGCEMLEFGKLRAAALSVSKRACITSSVARAAYDFAEYSPAREGDPKRTEIGIPTPRQAVYILLNMVQTSPVWANSVRGKQRERCLGVGDGERVSNCRKCRKRGRR